MSILFFAAILLSLTALPPAVLAVEQSVTPDSKTVQNGKQEIRYRKPMDLDQPMPTGMAKPGMKIGDVKNSAERKQPELEEMMREEMK